MSGAGLVGEWQCSSNSPLGVFATRTYFLCPQPSIFWQGLFKSVRKTSTNLRFFVFNMERSRLARHPGAGAVLICSSRCVAYVLRRGRGTRVLQVPRAGVASVEPQYSQAPARFLVRGLVALSLRSRVGCAPGSLRTRPRLRAPGPGPLSPRWIPAAEEGPSEAEPRTLPPSGAAGLPGPLRLETSREAGNWRAGGRCSRRARGLSGLLYGRVSPQGRVSSTLGRT